MSFYTDVIMKDHRFASTERISDPALLEPVTLFLVNKIIADAQSFGVSLMIYETYRSRQRQEMLFEKGVTELQQVGVHHYGLACDIVFDAGNSQPSWRGNFKLLGRLAHNHQLIWGGDWGNPAVSHIFQDNDHVQRCLVARQASLIRGDWYPDEHYDPYKDILTGEKDIHTLSFS